MTPQERYMAALRGGKPDQVPVSLSIGPSNTRRWLGREDWRVCFGSPRDRRINSRPRFRIGLFYNRYKPNISG